MPTARREVIDLQQDVDFFRICSVVAILDPEVGYLTKKER